MQNLTIFNYERVISMASTRVIPSARKWNIVIAAGQMELMVVRDPEGGLWKGWVLILGRRRNLS